MRIALPIAAFAAVLTCAVSAHGQSYPSRPIAMVVPFPAGGPTDTLARIVTERMRVSLGQPIIIENITGAGATIGVGRAVSSAPDGYTLSIGNWTSHVGSAALYPVQYDVLKDFMPVSLLTTAPMIIVGKNDVPAKDAKELIAW